MILLICSDTNFESIEDSLAIVMNFLFLMLAYLPVKYHLIAYRAINNGFHVKLLLLYY